MSNAAPLVSVVIPTYNAPALLLETLETVFSQTFRDYEIVVINDGSTDDTAQRLKPLHDSGRIRLISQANEGIGAARNRGMDEARGKYVALLDHDDLWQPEKLAVQTAFMEAHNQCIGCGVPWSFSSEPRRPVCDFRGLAGPDGVVQRPMKAMGACVFIMSSSMMFDRERTRGIRFMTYRRCIEDTPFHVKLFHRGPFGIAGENVEMIYRLHGTNSSSDAEFFYNGIKMLRRLDREGYFDDIQGGERRDMHALFATVGRTAIARQIVTGRRKRAAELYAREFFPQVLNRRWKFLAGAPVSACLGRVPGGARTAEI